MLPLKLSFLSRFSNFVFELILMVNNDYHYPFSVIIRS